MKRRRTRERFVERNSELRAETVDGAARLIGYGAVWDRTAEIWQGFNEIVRRGAFKKTMKEGDARALWNHAPGSGSVGVLGRVSSGTLRLEEDDKGLRYEVDLPDTSVSRDLQVLLERGDIRESSFAFDVIRENILYSEDGDQTRELLEVELFDVSPVAYPAYADTEAELRGKATAWCEGLERQGLTAEAKTARLEFDEFLRLTPAPTEDGHADGTPDGEGTRQHLRRWQLELEAREL